MKNSYKKITDYSIIGNLLTCALVGKDGSIDWYCVPHINSPSVFAGILDTKKGGHFFIRPSSPYVSEQKYVDHTNILETSFKTDTGYLKVTDFMPIEHVTDPSRNLSPKIFRKVECTSGQVDVDVEFAPRFDYGREKVQMHLSEFGVEAKNKDTTLYLEGSLNFEIKNDTAYKTFHLKQKESRWFVIQYNKRSELTDRHCENVLKTTKIYWKGWVNDCEVCYDESGLFKTQWREIVIRSGLVLKLLIQDLTGAICAAATTSIPEQIGGARNWDYRFNWIRDAAFTVRALYKMGYVHEARRNLEWFMNICTDNPKPDEIQIMYGLSGETELEEEFLDHLSGYMDSKPVRIGNGAAKQKQLDIYGELIGAFYETSRFGIDITEKEWALVCKIVDHVCEVWHEKDAGIWEVRGGYQHFVHSKLMCWHAINLAQKMARKQNKKITNPKWSIVKDKIKEEILEKGFNKKLNSFVQAYDSDILDATSLLIPIYKFLPYDDPRVQSTVDAIMKKLTSPEGYVYRYELRTDDGFECGEGAFILCSFWLVDVLAYSGRLKEAREILRNIIKIASPTGLFAEEVNPKTGELLGNYPQAYSHIGLINSALFIEKAAQNKHTKKK
jgi:GH15 family glucan-1,4-alpha-glucosidase